GNSLIARGPRGHNLSRKLANGPVVHCDEYAYSGIARGTWSWPLAFDEFNCVSCTRRSGCLFFFPKSPLRNCENLILQLWGVVQLRSGQSQPILNRARSTGRSYWALRIYTNFAACNSLSKQS